jgi:hypothetical protein
LLEFFYRFEANTYQRVCQKSSQAKADFTQGTDFEQIKVLTYSLGKISLALLNLFIKNSNYVFQIIYKSWLTG